MRTGVDGALVRLVQNDDTVLRERGVEHCLTQEHAVGEVLDDGAVRGLVVEAHTVAHL